MKHPISVELLEKYIKGLCTDEEVARVKAWYFSFEHEGDFVSGLTAEQEQQLEEMIYARIMDNIDGQMGQNDDTVIEPLEPHRRNKGWWYAIASAAAAILIVFGVWLGRFEKLTGNTIEDAKAQELVVISNNTRQLYKAVLPDASMVWLSPGAQLRFPRTFAVSQRAVTMSGECFFEVTKNLKRPFIISSRSIVTKVWGTSFRVIDHASSNRADVSVLTGKVSVSIKGTAPGQEPQPFLTKDEVMLYPNQKVTYLVDRNVLKPSNQPEANMRIWNRVNLNFENKPLSEIIPVLNARFNVSIKTTNEKLNHYILNADMAGFNLPDVLEALKKSLNVDYEIKDDVIELQ